MSLQNEIQTIFSHLGRTPIEANLYIAALALGSGTAAHIAKQAGEDRTKSYFHLRKLSADGLLKESRKGQRMLFVPLEPKEFADRVGKLATDLRSLVPQLESMQAGAVETPIIEVTESRAGHKRIYEELSSLPEGTFFRVLQGRKSLEEELRILDEVTLARFFDSLKLRNITTKGIFTKESREIPSKLMSEHNLLEMRERKSDLVLLPESILDLQQVMFIYQNKVAFLFPETSLVMTITHQGITDVLAASFDALHSFGEKVDPIW